MTEHTILIVDDEHAIREMVDFALTRAGYQVVGAEDAGSAIAAIAQSLPDLILLDWMLPDISGVDLARRLKKEELYQDIPIIMLTARVEEQDKVQGLEVGADDYVTKPFSTRELVARIKAVLRRTSPAEKNEALNVGQLTIDPGSHRVHVSGSELHLGPTEYRLLYFLMSHPDRVYSRAQLLDRVWGQNTFIEDRTVDVHVRRLRKVLSDSGYDHLIQTVRGAGYRFSAQAAA
ncbi:MAG TPA: phosphate regulon transcriptional regulatory protein PhoB [Gammaproteobacteria bacterium]|nr:phosphate regulon transcriptional regulatory protein PhoB [Gammaproteobacteria bacterium]